MKPIVNKITPFDSEFDNEFSFNWDGAMSHANRLIIYDSKTMDVVYDKKIHTSTLTHILPKKTLENGLKWIAQFQTFDVDDKASDLSDKVLFYTFKTPQFYFYEMADAYNIKELEYGKTITTSSYQSAVYYLQENYEDLQSYKFYLYDGTKTQLLESETMYSSSSIRYHYKGLENHTLYYFRCIGITANGMDVDTGYVQIYTDYEEEAHYGVLYAENDAEHGYIKYHTNIVVIQYNGTKKFKYIDGLIDLREDSIYYDTGFVIDDDFTLKLRGMYLNRTNTLLELRNNMFSLVLSSYLYDDGTIRFKLTVPNAVSKYILYSQPLTFGERDMVYIAIRRKNNIYKLDVHVDEMTILDSTMFYGQQKPMDDAVRLDTWIDDDKPLTHRVAEENIIKHLETIEPKCLPLVDDIDWDYEWMGKDIWIGGE